LKELQLVSVVEQADAWEDAIDTNPIKKPFVEPTVSVPTDVLEATRFFQQPTIESSTV
jgi:hypothetical protein